MKRTIIVAAIAILLALAACQPAPDPTPAVWSEIVIVFVKGDLDIQAWTDAGWTIADDPVNNEPPEDCTLHPWAGEGSGIDFVGVCSSLSALVPQVDSVVTAVWMDRETREVTRYRSLNGEQQ